MTAGNLLVEEAYYWNYSQHLDFGYLDHPPMVAVLIKLFTSLLGTNEFTVRLASLICWLITMLYSFKLSELMNNGSGKYSILLLSVLPFFFFQSIIITPDSPLLACWSSSLYYLYSALVLKRAKHWYLVGICMGLGLLSKYTIVLLSLPIFSYMLISSDARFWFKKKEPYLAALIVILLFTPVIYWNAIHQWISFTFQSVRRFENTGVSGTLELLWVSVFFLTPLGVWEVGQLFINKPLLSPIGNEKTVFVKCFTIIPWVFFFLYSFNHEINLNWIGPLFLGVIPWVAHVMDRSYKNRIYWFCTFLVLLVAYTSVFLLIRFNQSSLVQQKLLVKMIDWDKLVLQFDELAEQTAKSMRKEVVFIPLDNYPINSELAYYQEQLYKQGKVKHKYPSSGAHLFNRESLMYRYWSKNQTIAGKAIILLSKERWRFDDQEVISRVNDLSPLGQVWSSGQGKHLKNIPYFYKVVELK
ncbi:glycosyltransferase family 39 protein [Legionella waltersii]|nr:glycosyltransferase family 39 protein [Legionella waltersii]